MAKFDLLMAVCNAVNHTLKFVLKNMNKSSPCSRNHGNCEKLPVSWGFSAVVVLLCVCSFAVPASSACIVDCMLKSTLQPTVIDLNNDSCQIQFPENFNTHLKGPWAPFNKSEIPNAEPCKVQMNAPCQNCAIRVEFTKFELEPSCTSDDFSLNAENCDGLNECEYIIMTGSNASTSDPSVPTITHLHGNMTSRVLQLNSRNVALSFCYKMDSFATRNVNISFKAVVALPTVEKEKIPVAAWIFGGMAVGFTILLIIVSIQPYGEPENQQFAPKRKENKHKQWT